MSMTNGIDFAMTSFARPATTSNSAAAQADTFGRLGTIKTSSVTGLGEHDDTKLTTMGAALVQDAAIQDVNAAKVAALKSMAEAGTYNVSSAALADKLIQVLVR